MAYRIFYTDVSLAPAMLAPDFAKLIPLVCETAPLATNSAVELIEHGAIVWKIEGPQGELVNRSEIESEYARRTGHQPRRP